MELNLSPVLTTRNYGINSAKVDASVFCGKISKFEGTKIENGCDFLQKNSENKHFFCKMGEKFDEQLERKANVKLNFDITKNTEKPLVLDFVFSEKDKALVERIDINVRENVQAKIIVKFKATLPAYHNGLVHFECREGAKAEVVLVSDFAQDGTNILRLDNVVFGDAHLDFTLVEFGGKLNLQRYYARLDGERANSSLNCVYLAKGDSFVDLNFEQDVFGQKSEAGLFTVGALMGNATKHFKGTINFEKGCKKSVGSEDELCLLLSKTAKSKALPMILCAEEDVDGRHSSSVGRVEENELFYIMSRGISYEEALKMVVKAKFNGVLSKVFDENLKQTLIETVDKELDDEN